MTDTEREFCYCIKDLNKSNFNTGVNEHNVEAWLAVVQALCEHLNLDISIITHEKSGDTSSLNFRTMALEHLAKERRLSIQKQISVFAMTIEGKIALAWNLTRNTDIIQLNEEWKDRATTYISHIRKVVTTAEMEEGLRERIIASLNKLQSEVDKNRTRVEILSDIYLKFAEAINKGAKNLAPAMRLFERFAGAMYGIRNSEPEPATPRLPSPDKMNLPPPSIRSPNCKVRAILARPAEPGESAQLRHSTSLPGPQAIASAPTVGGAGADHLVGGQGSDRLAGGGSDCFVYASLGLWRARAGRQPGL